MLRTVPPRPCNRIFKYHVELVFYPVYSVRWACHAEDYLPVLVTVYLNIMLSWYFTLCIQSGGPAMLRTTSPSL